MCSFCKNIVCNLCFCGDEDCDLSFFIFNFCLIRDFFLFLLSLFLIFLHSLVTFCSSSLLYYRYFILNFFVCPRPFIISYVSFYIQFFYVMCRRFLLLLLHSIPRCFLCFPMLFVFYCDGLLVLLTYFFFLYFFCFLL